jgi:selenocysteine lyase/cysteine desulfurase
MVLDLTQSLGAIPIDISNMPAVKFVMASVHKVFAYISWKFEM